MVLPILYLSALFSFLIFMLAVLNILKKPSRTDSNSNLPPGPSKLPIIGNLHHLTGSLPHRKLRDLAKKYGPLMHLQLGEVSAIVVSSPEYAREVLKTHDLLFASRPEILASKIMAYDSTNIAFAPYSDYWRQLRKICTMELLSIKRVQSFRPIREEEIISFIRWIASKEGSPIDLTQAVNSLIYTITSRTAFGKKIRDHDQFISVVTQALGYAAGFDIVDLFPSAKWPQIFSRLRSRIEGLHEQADRIVGYIISEHKEARSRYKEGQAETDEDLIDVLLKYEDVDDEELEFRITINNIKAIILDIFGGGGDTAATTIDWAMAEMIKKPTVMKQAQAELREVFHRIGRVDETSINELKYLKALVKETLRLHPPGPLLLPRESRQACEINGYHIPLKTKVIINAWAIARDSNHWDEPDKFYPERFIDSSSIDYKGANFEYIPFGAGRRICPGMAFGLANLELVLASLLYHFDWELPGGLKGEDLDMEEVFGLTVRRKSNLCLIPIANDALPVT